MVATKFLANMVIVIAILAIAILIAWGLYINGSSTTNKAIDSLTSIKDTGENSIMCNLNAFNNACSNIASDSTGVSCLFKTDGSRNLDCTLCQRQDNGGTIYTCQLAICGCGYGFEPAFGQISLTIDKAGYHSGDIITAKGTVYPNKLSSQTSSGLDVKYSFLDSGKKATSDVGAGGATKTTDQQGDFSFTYTIPADTKPGDFYLIVEQNKASAAKSLRILSPGQDLFAITTLGEKAVPA